MRLCQVTHTRVIIITAGVWQVHHGHHVRTPTTPPRRTSTWSVTWIMSTCSSGASLNVDWLCVVMSFRLSQVLPGSQPQSKELVWLLGPNHKSSTDTSLRFQFPGANMSKNCYLLKCSNTVVQLVQHVYILAGGWRDFIIFISSLDVQSHQTFKHVSLC